MSEEKDPVEEARLRLKALEDQRKKRDDAITGQAILRRLKDTEAIVALEDKHGPQNIATREVSFIDPDTPILLAVRTPNQVMVKCFRDAVKGDEPDFASAYADLAAQCLVYPDPATYEKIKQARPGVSSQLGITAIALASSSEEQRGKGSAK